MRPPGVGHPHPETRRYQQLQQQGPRCAPPLARHLPATTRELWGYSCAGPPQQYHRLIHHPRRLLRSPFRPAGRILRHDLPSHRHCMQGLLHRSPPANSNAFPFARGSAALGNHTSCVSERQGCCLVGCTPGRVRQRNQVTDALSSRCLLMGRYAGLRFPRSLGRVTLTIGYRPLRCSWWLSARSLF